MKNKYRIIYVLIFLALVITAVGISLLPDTVPLHYNFIGEIDRYGSKYNMIIFLPITIAMGAFMLLLGKHEAKKKQDSGNEKVLAYINITILIFFNLLNIYSLYQGYHLSGDVNPTQSENSMYFSTIGIGILMCIMGNIMPKSRMNSVFGLRTVWSMKNENVWMKSQRFGGTVMIIGGIFLIIGSIILPKILATFFILAVSIIITLVSVIASYRIYKISEL